MHVGNGRTCELDIDIVVVSFTAVRGHDQRVRIEIDAADKGERRIEIGIDESGFLMLAVAGVCPIPTDVEQGIALRKHLEMVWRAPKGISSPCCRLVIGPPEDDTYIDTASGGAFEHVQCGAATI